MKFPVSAVVNHTPCRDLEDISNNSFTSQDEISKII